MHPIGKASKLSGVNIETIRYYERENITPKPELTPSGRRMYTLSDIGRLRFIKRCRDLGFSIPDIRAFMGFTHEPNAKCSDVYKISQKHLAKIRIKIEDLRNLENALTKLTSHCADGNTSCPMLDKLLAD